MKKTMLKAVVAAAFIAAFGTVANAATEITWWHAMGGELGKKLDEIVAKYNTSQTTYYVTASYKGSYPETMTAAIAAFRAKQQPDIVQVYDHLLCGSRNHLRAFNEKLLEQGVSYVPQVVTQAEWDAIANAPAETCGG